MVLDTSVLVEIALGSSLGARIINEVIERKIIPYTTSLNIIELEYVLCRLLGRDEALKRVSRIIYSGFFYIVDSYTIREEIASCKCSFPISLADCSTLALARSLKMPALFLCIEKEFRKCWNKRREWTGEILFLAERSR